MNFSRVVFNEFIGKQAKFYIFNLGYLSRLFLWEPFSSFQSDFDQITPLLTTEVTLQWRICFRLPITY